MDGVARVVANRPVDPLGCMYVTMKVIMSTTDGVGEEDASSSAGPEARPGDSAVGRDVTERPTVAAGQREYEAATARWFSKTVEEVMRATDPIYAQITHERVESVPDLVVNISEDQEMRVTPSTFTAGDVSVPGIVNGDLDDVHVIVASAADQMLQQVMTTLFAQVQEATGRVGNTVQAGEDLVESFLEGLSKMQVTFNETGRPVFQMVASPETATRFRKAMDRATPEQIIRFEEIMKQKREEFDATRRSRRLHRHGD